MKARVIIDGEVGDLLKEGKMTSVAFFFYDHRTDELRALFPDTISEEEGTALLRKFGCYPKDSNVRKD